MNLRQCLGRDTGNEHGVQVLNVTEYDASGVDFRRPDQGGLDVIITNGLDLACERESSAVTLLFAF